MNHTPTPWTIGQYQREIDANGEDVLVTGIYSSAEGVKVAKMEVWTGEEYRRESDANAEFVVTACNAHEEVVATLKGCLSWLSSYPGGGAMTQYDKVRTLLAAIEKGA